MAYTTEQIRSALEAELAARPGTSYEDMLAHAQSAFGLTPEQVELAYFDYNRDQGMSDADFNVWANDNNWVEQDVLDARDNWLDTADGQSWLSTLPDIQQDWANTFWVGDMDGAQGVLNDNRLTVDDLVNDYGITTTEIDAVGDRYGVVPYGSTPTKQPPTNPTRQQSLDASQPKVNAIQGRNSRLFGAYSAPANPNWQNRVTVGAAGNSMLGAGIANYDSELIKNLRIASAEPRSNNPGVAMVPNGAAPASNTVTVASPPSGNAFNPGIQDLQEWDPTPIFNDIYGRDPTAEELRDTRFLSEKDLRTSLNYWWDQYQKQQKEASAPPAPAPAPSVTDWNP